MCICWLCLQFLNIDLLSWSFDVTFNLSKSFQCTSLLAAVSRCPLTCVSAAANGGSSSGRGGGGRGGSSVDAFSGPPSPAHLAALGGGAVGGGGCWGEVGSLPLVIGPALLFFYPTDPLLFFPPSSIKHGYSIDMCTSRLLNHSPR